MRATKAHLAVAASIKGLNYEREQGVKNGGDEASIEGCWGTFGIAHMDDVVARVKRAILAHIVLVGTPAGEVRLRQRGGEEAKRRYTLHCSA